MLKFAVSVVIVYDFSPKAAKCAYLSPKIALPGRTMVAPQRTASS